MNYQKSVECWDLFEITLDAERKFEHPHGEVELFGHFLHGSRETIVEGFHDGGTTWKVRFMPQEVGSFRFRLSSNLKSFDGLRGDFRSTKAAVGNHGLVRVSGGHHFSYADGTPFFVLGTTVYAWTYRPQEVREETLASLAKYSFNKVRMLVFPKHLVLMDGIDISYEPPLFPFEGTPGHFDFRSPNPRYFQEFENRVRELRDLGIEADVILFHFYDFGQWGIDSGMDQWSDLSFLRYIIARLGAFRNVWWSLANEYDLLVRPNVGEIQVDLHRKNWDLLGEFIAANDPYGHLRSVHNVTFGEIYPNRTWLTHVSYQNPNTYSLMLDLRRKYGKPVIDDEYEYEGDVPHSWGNSSAELTVLRHWGTAMAGGYGTHGESYRQEGNQRDIFWTYGGTLAGQSAGRIQFLRQIMERCAYQTMEPDLQLGDGRSIYCLSRGADRYLFFFAETLPGKSIFPGPRDGSSPTYDVTVFDAWECTEKRHFSTQLGCKIGCIFDVPIVKWNVVMLVRKP